MVTYQSDKLVAISGLARRLHSLSPEILGRYLAGLWEFQLIFQLAWTTNESSRPLTSDYVATSWSWASVQQPVYREGQGMTGTKVSEHRLVSIQEVRTSPIADPFGQVSDGLLQVRGRSWKITLAFDTIGDVDQVVIFGVSLVTNDWYNSDTERTDIWVSLDHCPISPKVANDGNIEGFVLPLFHTQGGNGENEPWEDLVGIILKPTAAKQGQFTRMGQMRFKSIVAKEVFQNASL